MIIAGIDEAGRGPIIGPMVMAVLAIDEKDEQKLASIGVKDSKLLSPMQRKKIFHELQKFEHKIIIKTPAEIDNAVNSASLNLNWLEAQTTAELLNSINAGKAFIDCPSTNVSAYTNYLKKLLKDKSLKLVVEHKADEKYLVSGAASILAKVTRDDEIEKLKKKLNANFGSGYPSDPLTQNFVKDNFDKKELKGIFRESWETFRKLAEKKSQKTLFDA